jgi:type IV pilus assembly protein PilM
MFERLRQPVTLKLPRRGVRHGVEPGADEPVHLRPAAGEDDLAQASAADSQSTEPVAVAEQPAERWRDRRHAARSRSRRRPSRDATLVGLAIEPGLLVAAKSRLNGHVVVERAAFAPIGMDVVRDGEVNDVPALVDALSDLFKSGKLERRVRIGIANQRIMMRRIELPPLTDANEIRQAVLFSAQDEIPMPLESVILDYHSLGVDEGPSGQRLHVLLVAARRDMVERVLQAARLAGLQPEGVDLAAFGMIRALQPADVGADEQILYLSIGGLTNLAISRGTICDFTRVIPWGAEQIAGDVASRCGIALDDARRLLVQDAGQLAAAHLSTQPLVSIPLAEQPDLTGTSVGAMPAPSPMPLPGTSVDPSDLMSGPPAPSVDTGRVVATALNDGIRRIASEVRHSLDFYLAGRTDSPVKRALLCGPALEIPGFADALSRELGITVLRGEVALATPTAAGDVPLSILPVAAGLSVADGPQ